MNASERNSVSVDGYGVQQVPQNDDRNTSGSGSGDESDQVRLHGQDADPSREPGSGFSASQVNYDPKPVTDGGLFGISGEAISKKIDLILNFYEQLKGPYRHSQQAMTVKLKNQNDALRKYHSDLALLNEELEKMLPVAQSASHGPASIFHGWTNPLKKKMARTESDEAAANGPESIKQLKNKISEIEISAKNCQREIDELESGLDWSARKIAELGEESEKKIAQATNSYDNAIQFHHTTPRQ